MSRKCSRVEKPKDDPSGEHRRLPIPKRGTARLNKLEAERTEEIKRRRVESSKKGAATRKARAAGRKKEEEEKRQQEEEKRVHEEVNEAILQAIQESKATASGAFKAVIASLINMAQVRSEATARAAV